MRFLLDEGLPYRLARYLQDRGHDAATVGHDYPYALADRDILAIAKAERRIVLTNDKDFGDLIFRDRLSHEGVILFRLGYVPLEKRIELLERVLTDHPHNLHALVVVSPRGIRVRQSRGEESP